jgi:hypothetical protein
VYELYEYVDGTFVVVHVCYWCTVFVDLGLIVIFPGFVKCMLFGGHAVTHWLRHYATNRKVAGSIPDGVRIFH